MLVRWVPPSEGAVKLNVDGSSRGNPGRAGCGGLLRDENGSCIAGFVSHIGIAGSLLAELIAIRHGLLLAWQYGFRRVECESDCLKAVQIIHSNTGDFPYFESIVEEINQLLLLDWDVKVYHVLREANSCADYLAKIGSSTNTAFAILLKPPTDLSPLLLADSKGVFYSRA